VRFYSQIGQDIWVLETPLPGVRDGFFLDVGSADGTSLSNTKALEERGWKGICVDPFPTHYGRAHVSDVQRRRPQRSRQAHEVQHGWRVRRTHRHIGRGKAYAEQSPAVEFTTVTLDDILTRAKAPHRIDFMSLDIEGAELEALRGFPFDRYQLGALAVEHNFEEPKRGQILDLMKNRGFTRVTRGIRTISICRVHRRTE
jgi:FkbM family methyltransferase